MKTRVISAVVAISIIIALYTFLELIGLYIVCFLVTAVCGWEYLKMTLMKVTAPSYVHYGFYISLLVIYGFFVLLPEKAMGVFCLVTIVFLTTLLSTAKKSIKLSRITLKQGLGVMGFIYCGIFPALATRLLQFDDQGTWLICLMAFVFTGDTFAYLTGKTFGKRKLFETVSPKKTLAGSFGGLFGSALAGIACSFIFFKGDSALAMALVATLTGLFAQIGDLFESLLKRVAKVKDSGNLMPGHGGILDRVDGIYFGAPVLFTCVSYF